jgi:hypothetical protein
MKAVTTVLLAVLVLVLVLIVRFREPGAAHETAVAAQEMALRPEPIDSPAPAGSAEPQLTVSRRGVLLSWIEQTGTYAALKFAERTASGWTSTRQVAAGSDWFVNWADVPSVLRLEDGTIYGHWLQKSGQSTYAYDVRLARSADDGKTFGASFTPHRDGTQTEHGFAALFQAPGAGLGLVWLDGRAMAKSASHDAHAGHEAAGDMSVRAAIYDPAGKQVFESAIDDRVCECCPTAITVTSEGPLVAYRDRSGDEVRDIYVSRFASGTWSTPVPVHADEWKIAACPVNGPALSAEGRRVAIAWFSARGDEPHAFAAFLTDAGKSFGAPIRLDDAAALGRVDIQLLADGSALTTWIEFADGRAQFKARRVNPDGGKDPAFTVAGLAASRASGYPRMARFADEVIFAWTDTSEGPRVRVASLKVPGNATAK